MLAPCMICVTLPCLLELSYTFDHIWINLLTQCTQLPVPVFCCFCISGFPPLKVLQKFRKNYIKNQRPGSFRNNQGREGGHHKDSRRVPGAAPPWAAPGTLLAALWAPWCPPLAP